MKNSRHFLEKRHTNTTLRAAVPAPNKINKIGDLAVYG